MPQWKPAFLIHGDDHGRLAERRANLRRMAEAEAGAGGVEVFEGEAATPSAVALALGSMTFAIGHRFLIVEGVERWKDSEVEEHVTPALKSIAPDTTVAFFGREEGRAKVPKKLAAAVKAAGGVVATEELVKGKELPRWVADEARRLDLEIEGAAARRLVELVGDRQQRLTRELEKLALEHGAGHRIGVEEVEAVAAPSAEHQVWGFVDALVARDAAGATRAFLELREQGEALGRLVPQMARRLREAHAIAVRLEAGERPDAIKASLSMPPWMADKRLREARGADAEALRHAIEAVADLELATRGLSELSDDTAAVRAIAAVGR